MFVPWLSPTGSAETPDAAAPLGAISDTPRVLFRVLASGSSGNCSVLVIENEGVRRACLIDLGLSPRHTLRLLGEMGLRPDQIDDAILTHLDHDHVKLGWCKLLPAHARLHVHRRHVPRARSMGLRPVHARFATFDDHILLHPGVEARPLVMSHDEDGVVVFRFEFAHAKRTPETPDGPAAPKASMGFATDLGCVTGELIEHLYGVDVLAIESNYCPRLQAESARPEYLKQRIMGGSGHLSNQQALDAILGAEPREHVVLLHLSRECNSPAIVHEMHEGSDYALTISSQFEPTRWVHVGAHAAASRP
jgi:phosphoribosyl 1,2-cyclic phosphodiesterase